MVRKSTIRLLAFVSAAALGGFIATSAPATRAADSDKCSIATKGDNPVVKACAKGGIKEAKKTMKAMVKVAKDKGKKLECDNCHEGDENWKLTKDSEKLFKDLLALQPA
jgi:ABC-type sugar transport system substrate-binding protein